MSLHVAEPDKNASAAQLDEAERQCLASITEVNTEVNATETAALGAEAALDEETRRMMGASAESRNEVNLAMDVVTEALGTSSIKLLKDVGSVLSDRGSDPGKFSIGGRSVQTMEDTIRNSAAKGPGLWPAGKGSGKSELVDRANITDSSLNGHTKQTYGAAKFNAENLRGTAQYVQKLTFEKGIANEKVLGVVQRLRAEGPQAPGLGGGGAQRTLEHTLAMGPRGPSDDMLTEEEQGAMA